MINIEELLNNNSFNRNQLLLNYYNLIDINENELVVLLLIENMIENNILVTVERIKLKMSLPLHEVEKIIIKLIDKKLLVYDRYSNNNNIDNSNVYERIFDALLKKQIEELNNNSKMTNNEIIDSFKCEFKRELTPLEYQTLKEWLDSYSNDIIIKALKEAVFSGIVNFKNIEINIKDQMRFVNG